VAVGGCDHPTANEGREIAGRFLQVVSWRGERPAHGEDLHLRRCCDALNQVAPYDWRGFWTERLSNHGPGAPLGGVEGSGWKLVYDENPSDLDRAEDRDGKSINAHYSVGLMAASDGAIRDTVEGMLAAKAGIGPGMKIVAVNGRRFSADAWHDAIRAAKTSPSPIELIVENTDYFRVVKLDYHGGEKYPRLVRDESKPDLLTEIYRAK
jgi:predicted metalloprotease with PDZ domain